MFPAKRKRLTLRIVDATGQRDRDAGWETHWDDGVRGLALRCSPTGHRAWLVMRRVRGESRPTRIVIGNAEFMPLDRARAEAKRVLADMDAGVNPLAKRRQERARRQAEAQAAGEFKRQAELYMRQVSPGMRSAADLRRVFEATLIPAFGARRLNDVRRRDVMELLDEIKEKRGPGAARRTLTVARGFFNWFALRDEGFTSPIVRGMGRDNVSRARDRILTDAEIVAMWSACDEAQPRAFGTLCKLLLLTGQRRLEIGNARWDEIKDGALVIPASRYKTKIEHRVPLSQPVRGILAGLPRLGDYIITVGGERPLAGLNRPKKHLDSKLLKKLRALDPIAELPPWTLHDLRRTARSLMARAGIHQDHAERVLGHVIRGVAGVYDRHRYEEEKAAALDALAMLVERIVVGHTASVTPLRRAASA
ncbi:MAG: tyrosine-type recombinase/integrase [Rhodospirillaceae bacterium]|nr:tyrosine-type recombinase/integrase [Rhodospirillaceae bacterium]